MALNPDALITLAQLKEELGITDDAENDTLEFIINAVSASIAGLLKRTLHYQEEVVEKVRGFGHDVLELQLTPLLEVTNVQYTRPDGSVYVFPVDSYYIDDSPSGSLGYRYGTWPSTQAWGGWVPEEISGTARHLYEVTCTGGWVTPQQEIDLGLPQTLPMDIQLVALRVAAQTYRDAGVDTTVRSRRILAASKTWFANRAINVMGMSVTGDGGALQHYKRFHVE